MQRQLCHLIAPVTANWQVLSRFPKFVPQSLRVAAPSFQTASARIHVEERRCWRNTVGRSFHASSRALGEDKSSAEQPSVLTKQDGERDVPVSRWSVGGPRPDRALATATCLPSNSPSPSPFRLPSSMLCTSVALTRTLVACSDIGIRSTHTMKKKKLVASTTGTQSLACSSSTLSPLPSSSYLIHLFHPGTDRCWPTLLPTSTATTFTRELASQNPRLCCA